MPIATDDDLLGRAGEIAAHAAEVAAGRRRHAPIVFFWLPSGELESEPLQARLERQQDAWHRIAGGIERRDARGLVFVGEGWSPLAGDDGELVEALLVAAITASGRERLWAAPVIGRGLRSTRLGELVTSDDERPSFLAPVRAVWGIEVG